MQAPASPLLIQVPVDLRPGRPPTIDDLDMEYWIMPPSIQRNVIDLETTRHFVITYPGTYDLMADSYMVYYEDQGNNQNRNRTLKALDIAPNWKGNIVVMKNVNKEQPVDMEASDIDFVVQLMKE